MGVVTVREFNSSVSRVIARVEAGETIDISKDGKVVAELRPKRASKLDDPTFRAAYEKALKGLAIGVPGLVGPATYDERTER